MTTLFQNARQVAHYASYRPTYPTALFDRIAAAAGTVTTTSNTTKHSNNKTSAAADIGCGTGQATIGLVDIFDQVTGVDPSEAQIQAALLSQADDDPSEYSIDFVVGRESQLPFPDQSLDCVTSAQAAHWFDLPAFYAQVDRVLQPNGVLAIWCYGLPQFPRHAALQQAIHYDLYEHTLGPYWDDRRRLVENLYRDLETIDKYYQHYQTETIENDEKLHITREASSREIIGYLRSWSAYAKYCEDHAILDVEGVSDKSDPLDAIEKLLVNLQEPILMVSPVRLLLSRRN